MNKISLNCGRFAMICLLGLSPFAHSHHSTYSNFDRNSIIELQGTITGVSWRNPHVRFSVLVEGEGGIETEWEIEANSVSGLRRKNITRVLLAAGDQVRIAGNPSLSGDPAMWVTNLLRSDGPEYVLAPGVEARWSTDVAGTSGPTYALKGDDSRPELGIFRVWSHTNIAPMLFPSTTNADFDIYGYPLTESARAALADYNPATDNPTRNCNAKGMPTIMEQPYPMQIMRLGGDIVFKLEEYDTVRTVHMDPAAAKEAEANRLGHSTGRFDGSVLVVETRDVNWGYFNQAGIPLSGDVRIVEYFSPSEDGSRLDYRIVVTDPASFTEPVELKKFWLAVPGVSVQRYECLPDS